jgi:hypothetical protein
MRVSLVARFVSHPSIDFGPGRRALHRSRLGLDRQRTVYHLPRTSTRQLPTVHVLRSQTSRFRFPSVGRPGRAAVRHAAPPFDLPRARRA